MSSKKGFTSGSASASNNGKNVVEAVNPTVEQLGYSLSDVKLDSVPDGEWEVYTKKSKGRGVGSTANRWGPQRQAASGNSGRGNRNTTGSAWPVAPVDPRWPTGRGTGRQQPPNHIQPNSFRAPTAVQAPLKNGWNWASVASSGSAKGSSYSGNNGSDPHVDIANVKSEDDDDDTLDDSDDDLASDEFDSDVSQKSHETRKTNRWFKKFFESLDGLTQEEINEPGRQWHCPACQGGPGAIDWFKGLQPLMTHAKTKGSKRVKLHREFAELLDEELSRRGTSAYPSGEAFGKWKGLTQKTTDYAIVWPPMVVVMNTRLEQDEKDKWIGMGNQELLEYFQDYKAIKARHSYGPQGHRGISVLIFEGTAVGYSEAERLHKHFEAEGTDREAWDRRRVLFYPAGQRQLYGFLATKEDLDTFNRHCQVGKTILKFDMRSHHEMVVIPLKQMSEDNQQLIWLKHKVAKEQRHSKALEESFGIVSEKLRQTMEENRIVRQRTKWQHEEYREEMDSQEGFYKEQMQFIQEARDARDDKFEMEQQEKREKVKQLNAYPSINEDGKARELKIQEFIKSQESEMEEFVAERDRLGKLFEARKVEMKKRHWEEEMELEKDYDAELFAVMEKYTPKMSSKKGFTSGSASATNNGKNVVEAVNPTVEQLGYSLSDVKLDSAPDGEGEFYTKKSKGRGVGSTASNWGPQRQAAPGNVGRGNRRPTGRGRGTGRQQPPTHIPPNNYRAPTAVQTPLKNGLNWVSVASSGLSKGPSYSGNNGSDPHVDIANVKSEDDDDDVLDDSDDDLASDEFDSDVSQKSHETLKTNRWFKKFFESLDGLTQEEINEPGRPWHCPACRGGPGAIDRFIGLQPLMTHAKTKGSRRVKLHREFADLLDEELSRRGTSASAYPSGEAFGKWKGLTQKKTDNVIVWPPMVVVMNTQLEQDENDKWIGMGNRELLDYFQDYKAIKPKHSFGPQGHRGMSVLIFEGTAVGYSEAERLHKHFEAEGTDREAWDRRRVLFYPGGQRQLYGFLATKEDLDTFNRHCQGKTKLKFDMKSHHEMVVIPLKQMSEDNQQLIWVKHKFAEEQRQLKALLESCRFLSEKLRQTMEENRIVRQRIKWQHEEYREEMDSQEAFYKEQMKFIHEARDARDDMFEMEQQEKREKVKQPSGYPSINEDSKARERKIQEFIESQDSEMQEFVAERDRLGKLFEVRKVEMKKRHWEEEMKHEKDYDAELFALMEKYTPKVDNTA